MKYMVLLIIVLLALTTFLVGCGAVTDENRLGNAPALPPEPVPPGPLVEDNMAGDAIAPEMLYDE